MKRYILLAAAATLLVATAQARQPEPAREVESAESLREAQEAAERSGKHLVVLVTASWCEPCKQVRESALGDDRVARWMGEKAVPVVLDVDVHPEIVAPLVGAAKVPTLVVMKEGRELDRAVGPQTADQLAEFLAGIDQGRRAVDRYRERAGDRDAGKVDAVARMDLARALLFAREYEEAADEYAWLWSHMLEHDPAMAAQRAGLAGDIARLVREHPEAADRFALLRDLLREDLHAGKAAPQTLTDWIALSRALGEVEPVLAWIDAADRDEKGRVTLLMLYPAIADLLYEHGRWAIAGRIVDDPQKWLKRLERHRAAITAPPGADERAVRAYEERNAAAIRREAARLYAAALAAGKEDRATEVLFYALLKYKEDPRVRREMIETALRAGQPRRNQLGWLPSPDFDDLRERVERAVNSAP